MTNFPYKLVIFDFDGTLADSFGWFLDVSDSIADRFGCARLDRADLDALRRLGSHDLLKQQKVPLWKLPAIAAYARQLQAEQIGSISRFDGVGDMLRRLKARGVTLAVVTSNTQANVLRVLGPELSGLIDHWGEGASLFGKAGKFKAVVKAAGVAPKEALSVGDELRDIDAARKVGIRTGAVAWGYAHPERLALEKPDHLFHALADIADL